MMWCLRAVALVLILTVLSALPAAAQTTGSSLRGYVKDEQGGALPGVTVTATSPDMISPATGVTDGEGYYRLINLPPGTYTITAELAGFSIFKREEILLRAAVNFQVDIAMKIGTLSETVTVSGESPMLEVSKPGNVLNIDGEFQKAMPLAARRNWTDFLEQTPGVHSRPFDDGSGRAVLLRPRDRALRSRRPARGHAGRQLQRLPADLRADGVGHDPGHAGQDRRVRRWHADGHRAGDQRDHQERRQYVQGNRRVRVPAAPLGRRQHVPQDGVRADVGRSQPTRRVRTRSARPPGARPCRRRSSQFDGSFGGPIRKDQRLVLRLVPQVGGPDVDQPQLEEQGRHPGVLPERRAVPPGDQGLPALREGHGPPGQRPRAVGVLPARSHARPEQLGVLLRSRSTCTRTAATSTAPS